MKWIFIWGKKPFEYCVPLSEIRVILCIMINRIWWKAFRSPQVEYSVKFSCPHNISRIFKNIYIHPEHVSAHYHLGLSYLQNHEIYKAIQIFRKVLKLNPKHKGAAEKIEYLTDVPSI
ncbi:MAG: tetratricopeptide repeat protein [Candidatus Cloacimonetes bacterium]|nr:tetratricopeptide repeat protein [Candidatus Cloacimonadota bacterium]